MCVLVYECVHVRCVVSPHEAQQLLSRRALAW